MTAEEQRSILNNPVAVASLSDHERMIVLLVSTPMPDGKRRTITGIAKGLGVSRQSIHETLRRVRRAFFFAA